MRIKTTSRNYKLKKHEQSYIEEKVQNFKKYMKIDHVDVIVNQQGYQFEMEIILKAMHKNFIIKKVASTIEELTDILVNKMSHRLSKHKDKVKSHQKEKSQTIVNEIGAANPYSIIYSSSESLDEYTHQEAADKLIATNENFVVYVDSFTKRMSVAILKNINTIEFIES